MGEESVLFKGISQVSIDAKGRMAIPVKYRQVLMKTGRGQLVLTIDTDGCLLVYPKPIWQKKIEPQLTGLPGLNKQARMIQRIFLGHASECEMDAQGRLLLPSPLREVAGIKKQAVLVGQGWKFELWDDTRWQARREQWMKEAGDGRESAEVLESICL